MLCVTLKAYTRACLPTTGGLSNLWTFDPLDFDWTPGSGVKSYATVARRTGATSVGGAKMFPVDFLFEEGQFKATQKQQGCSTSWSYELTFQLPQLGQAATDYLNTLSSAACCCGLGLVVALNDGTILIMGERYVSAAAIPRWVMKLDGAGMDSGKTFTDYNGSTLSLKGDYLRAPNEFTGGIAAITALEA